MAALKTCFKCGAEKPRTEFYKHPQMADGLLGKCKRCTRLDVRVNRAANIDRYREYDRIRYRQNECRKMSANASFRAAGNKHPNRKKAAAAVSNALRDGRLHRQPCWVCGLRAQAHHPDYSRPLDVVWLCLAHHRQAHNMLRRIDQEITP